MQACGFHTNHCYLSLKYSKYSNGYSSYSPEHLMKTIILTANSSWYLYNFRGSSIKRLLSKDYKVICISPHDQYTSELQSMGCNWHDIRMSSKTKNPFVDLILIYDLFKAYKLYKPIAIFHFTIKPNIYGTWAATLSGIPSINNISGLGTAFVQGGLLSFFVRFLYKISQSFAHLVFCQNDDDYQLLVNKNLVPKNKLYKLPGSGVDIQRFNPTLKQHYPKNKIFTFLYVGRMIKDKGLLELVEAISRLNSLDQICNLILCGFARNDNHSDIPKSLLESWNQLPGISWVGPSDEVEQVMAGVDAVVLPSYREGMPRSILEALAMELPVVVTNVPGCNNIVDHEINGFLCKARNIASLERALKKMLFISSEERQAMGIMGRKKIEKYFDEEIVIQSLLDAIHTIESLNNKA